MHRQLHLEVCAVRSTSIKPPKQTEKIYGNKRKTDPGLLIFGSNRIFDFFNSYI